MPYLRPFESYGRFCELYMFFKGLFLSLIINRDLSHFKPFISFSHSHVRYREIHHWSFQAILLILSSISSLPTWIQEAGPPLEFIDPSIKGYAWRQKYSRFADFHLRSNFQIFKVIPPTLTVWSLRDIQCISMRLAFRHRLDSFSMKTYNLP